MSWLSENRTGNDLGKKAIEKQKHVGKCKMNHMGGSASMETEDVKRIFQRSEKTALMDPIVGVVSNKTKPMRQVMMFLAFQMT